MRIRFGSWKVRRLNRALFALELFFKKHTCIELCLLNTYGKIFIFRQGHDKEPIEKLYLPLWIQMVSICAPVFSPSSEISSDSSFSIYVPRYLTCANQVNNL